jgi:type IV fimbrial biogenesis protein FimT
MRTHTQRPQKGVTLLELMVGIAVFAVLVGLGVPSFFEIINNNRTTTQANELVAALNLARSEAVKRGNPVSVCSSSDGADCDASTTWTSGWIVFEDVAGASGTVDGGDVIIQVWPATAGLALTSSGNFVQYVSTGMPQPIGATTFALQKSGCSGDKARQISVSTTGRVSSAKTACT